MSEAIFGLAGVIVGGLLQGGWGWAMERRRESWAVRKAARLFGPALYRCALAINHAVEHPSTWGDLMPVIEANLERWPEHSEMFAGTLALGGLVQDLRVGASARAGDVDGS